ncbi:bifunctional precorrin-2 dehydrogenase/sirohydrochlorin ferrochelatase [Ureibacillus thermophilus]|uniref:precorrin-2 dehydrogenase n=1 Tax=Ureibacillus thermophilus TaxID=367743 RepID=A0A4P6UUA9_9BACL|nr:bifunctional precorrin-2 dehydrogenase/sirohydrochlorin ferrochelatase [Ureibacillus thermophilus]QBK26135.1 bifunctional precorrin-2 dehydrogenase/sirohydrochlorin ferrochelatase [Ureibacillus thermophilus]
MYYPMMMNLEGKNVVIIGGGHVAYQKLKGLEGTNAIITVVSPEILPEIKEWILRHDAKWIPKEFEPSDIEHANLIFAATNQPAVQREIKKHKKNHQLLLLADRPNESDFITPATLHRGKLSISISTNGASPSLAKKIKKELEQQFDENFGEYVQFLEEARKMILNQIDDPSFRKYCLTRLLDSDFYKLTMKGNIEKRNQLLQNLLNSCNKNFM